MMKRTVLCIKNFEKKFSVHSIYGVIDCSKVGQGIACPPSSKVVFRERHYKFDIEKFLDKKIYILCEIKNGKGRIFR